jgi:hypothetical protein
MYTSDPLMYLEYRAKDGCQGPSEWERHPRHNMAIHPVHAKLILSNLKRVNPSQEFRLIEMPEEEIPF